MLNEKNCLIHSRDLNILISWKYYAADNLYLNNSINLIFVQFQIATIKNNSLKSYVIITISTFISYKLWIQVIINPLCPNEQNKNLKVHIF